jgi:hypothetical protein
MWVRIVGIFKSDPIHNCNFSNKSNPKTDKPKDFQIRSNINKYWQFWEKLRLNYSKTLVNYHNFLDNFIISQSISYFTLFICEYTV